MAHCKKEDLEDVADLIEQVRTIEPLTEKSFGCFYLKSKGVLHFHKNKDGRRFAHLWNGKSWEELDLVAGLSKTRQTVFFKSIKAKLPLP